jgi:hypothetical protein
MGGEVLLYWFSVWVEVIEIVNLIQIEIVNLIWIQIGLEFRKDLIDKKPFSFLYRPWAEMSSPTQPGAGLLPYAWLA